MVEHDDLSRREFFKDVALAGIALPTGLSLAAGVKSVRELTAQIQNDFFSVTFDTLSGRLHIRRHDDSKFISGAAACARIPFQVRSSNQSTYEHTIESRRIADQIGEGCCLMVRSKDQLHQLDFQWFITLYDALQAIKIKVQCRNVTDQPVILQTIEPIRAESDEGGALQYPATTKILTNGQMYTDPGSIFPLDSSSRRSWWNICFFQDYNREALVCGALQNQTAFGQLVVRREMNGNISFTAESRFADGFVLEPQKEISSNPFMFNFAPDPYTALETFAEIMGKTQSARTHSLINGWCSWFYTFEHVTEDEVIRNAEFAARILRPYGLEYIQIDEGYQRLHGDWEGNEKFPHGMKWLAERIRTLGLKPGLWIAPYVISEPTRVFQEHPEWLLRHADGRLMRVGPWPSEDSDWAKSENPKRYGLDITHPQAASWLAELFAQVANQWGYEMIKIDFVGWSLLAAQQYFNPGISPAAAYRQGFEIMRRSIGDKCHLQDCGPGPVTVGLLDSMRIELDQNYGFRENAWQQYFRNPSSSAAAAGKRYYFHRRAWINDADHVCLNLLSISQAQAAASLIALTGGNLISGDRLSDLDSTRLEILKKVFPSSGEAARPIDLFENNSQTAFSVSIKRPFAEWNVLGLFNSDETKIEQKKIPLQRLIPEASGDYIVYDFWQERLHGVVEQELCCSIPPGSVALLAIHKKQANPQVISTDRHVLQGALELEDVHWNEETQTLHGISTGPLGSTHHVMIYVPEPQKWVQGGIFLYHDFPDYTIKMMDQHLMRLYVKFERSPRVIWQVCFQEMKR
ncbi:MAG: alpha-galactosidase [Calditrichaeota bacterium]|nr:MAG: alpha-galactosidase [Calditrichota bacterium]